MRVPLSWLKDFAPFPDDPEAMYESLTTRLDRVPDSAILFPGHQYSRNPSASMGDTRENNFVFKPKSAKDWLEMFGA